MPDSSKVTLHMVSSLDGYIAKKDNNVDWMYSSDHYEEGIALTDDEIANFLQSIDCYVMGSRTYELALDLGWPYGDTPAMVLTSRTLRSEKNNVEFHSGDLESLVNRQFKNKYNNIWVVGGAEITKQFLLLKLADEIVISIMPIILGDGIRFFDYIGMEQPLHLLDARAYKDGLVELTYAIKKV